ncbi:MAG: hypothetical protein MI922_18790, partial [Bacteroidales bacterium]|nr:hypothetical protein [Bacteroidales bacterium]
MKINKTYIHIGYWIFIIFILIMVFGNSWQSKMNAFYFISLLLPVIMATSYFFNYYLVPKYLLVHKYFKFAIYTAYTIIISLFLEMSILIFTFSYLLEYHMDQMN